MANVKERIALLNAKTQKKDEPILKKGPPPPKVDIIEKKAPAARPSIEPTTIHSPSRATRTHEHAELDGPGRSRIQSVYKGEKSKDIQDERDVVLSDYSAEEAEILKRSSSDVMTAVIHEVPETEPPKVESPPKIEVPPKVETKAPEPVKPPPPEPTPEEIAISERAAWFLAASETLDDSKPLPKSNWEEEDDDAPEGPTQSKSKEETRQAIKDRMAAVVGDAPKPKKEPRPKLPELPAWEDTAWSPAFKVEGKQAHAETMSAGVAKSVIEQLTKRANAPEVANAGFLAVTSLSLHSQSVGSLWKNLEASKVVLNCLNLHNRDAQVTFNGLRAVEGLARTEADDLMKFDAPTSILLAMTMNSKNARVAEQGCVTLSFLAGNSPDRIAKLKQAGTEKVLENLKQAHGKDPTCAFSFIALGRTLKQGV